jgi:predicted metal-dependent hydrolase
MSENHPTTPPITHREGLDFGLDGDIPRHWFAGDAFKTRFFDAMSTLFPEGERFFIACVRDYKDQIQDPQARRHMLDFAKQEAQHGKVHQAYNKRLAAQGVKVDRILANQHKHLFEVARQRFSKRYTLALTAASEHLTAVMAEGFMRQLHQFERADPRVRALYVWHGVEEIEHKAVAYDVMQQVAEVGYVMRAFALLMVSTQFPLFVFQIVNHMLKVDGYSRRERFGIWLQGLRWFYGPGGIMLPLIKPYLAWFRPGFHPWDTAMPSNFQTWEQAMRESGDPIHACDAAVQATLA